MHGRSRHVRSARLSPRFRVGVDQTSVMDETEQLAALARVLKQLLLASYGLRPNDLAREVASAVGHLGASDAILLLADYDQQDLVAFDSGDDTRHPIDETVAGLAYREERTVEEHTTTGRRIWIPVKDSAERVGVLGVLDDGTVPHDAWEAVASLVGELVVSKDDYGDHITRRRRTRDFVLAAEMRWALLPPLTFTSPDIAIAAFLQPSYGIAGDAFDYAVTSRTASVSIFDAMGHGLESSRMANDAVAVNRNQRRAGADAVTTLAAVGDVIERLHGDGRFVTAQVARLDLDTGRTIVANAGHLPPLRLREGQPPEEVACAPSLPCGLGGEPSTTTIDLEPGDILLFRTDGITEARSPAGEPFGDERLTEMVAGLVDDGLPAAEILRRSVRSVLDHQDGRSGDDATLLLVRWPGADAARPVL
jgi:Stage II sporulation protein E (SpoIIE)